MQNLMLVDWDIHADDFGVSLHASRDIVHLCKMRKLDSISIMPNMSCYEACMELFEQELIGTQDMPKVSVHLNFMEGHCVAHPAKVPDLVDADGFFKVSWGELLLDSYRMGKYQRMKEQLKTEIFAQLMKIKQDMPEEYILRIDSHQHTHMIPIVFRSLMEVIDENELKIEFIRNSDEPIGPFLTSFSLIPTYEPINLIKNVIIKWYAIRVRRKLKTLGLKDSCLWGLIMSGCMDERRINVLKEKMGNYARKRERTMEVLFHPGIVRKEEIGTEFVKEGFVDFHLSKGRKIEYHGVSSVDFSG